jgi:hypothetical protein
MRVAPSRRDRVRASVARTLSRKCGVQNEQTLIPYAVGLRVAKRSALIKAGSFWRVADLDDVEVNCEKKLLVEVIGSTFSWLGQFY